MKVMRSQDIKKEIVGCQKYHLCITHGYFPLNGAAWIMSVGNKWDQWYKIPGELFKCFSLCCSPGTKLH